MPWHILSRSQFVRLVQDLVSRTSVQRAITENGVELLGVFEHLTDKKGGPGWICRTTSRHGRVWLLGVTFDMPTHTYRVIYLDSVPWRYWMEAEHLPKWSRGDNPDVYQAAKSVAQAAAPGPAATPNVSGSGDPETSQE